MWRLRYQFSIVIIYFNYTHFLFQRHSFPGHLWWLFSVEKITQRFLLFFSGSFSIILVNFFLIFLLSVQNFIAFLSMHFFTFTEQLCYLFDRAHLSYHETSWKMKLASAWYTSFITKIKVLIETTWKFTCTWFFFNSIFLSHNFLKSVIKVKFFLKNLRHPWKCYSFNSLL